METINIIYGLTGLVIGGLSTSIWLGYKIKDLKNTILDKRTIVRFLKEALDAHKPKKTYKRKPTKKYRSNDGKTKATRKPVTRKKYEKAS
tara:strand:- start:50 stop:319 length:270 start_codon:yes stop_codon:yes gene_type:complete